MTVIPNQPALPVEEQFYPLEELFISESPPNLWPTNQNSNFGSVRRAFMGELQKGVDLLTQLFAERFVESASGYLSRYERDLGIPINPTGLTLNMRRERILRRMWVGPFTRARRLAIVEAYLIEIQSLGAPTGLTSEGVPLTAGGVTLFNEPLAGPITSYYAISEDVESFSYIVVVDESAAIDQQALQRELEHFTPAGIYFQIVRLDLINSIFPSSSTYPSSTTYP